MRQRDTGGLACGSFRSLPRRARFGGRCRFVLYPRGLCWAHGEACDASMEKALYRPVALIPVYNHAATLPAVVEAVRAAGLPCLLVDDGSEAACAAVMDGLAAHSADNGSVLLIRLAQNGGKGAAVAAGLRHALDLGYTHALQVDADGQHDFSAIARFIEASRVQPDALIGGLPVYQSDAPKSRRYGRWVMRIWVWINTLSTRIPDAMCGFRVYPLRDCIKLLNSERLGRRMDFDPEILVRLFWRAVPMRWLPVAVHYPQDGVSHFKLWRDNLLLSWMHTRLFFGMLYRAPRLVRRCVGDCAKATR